MKALPFALFAGLLACPAMAQTVTLTAAKDNTLFQNTSGSLSNGAGPYLYSGATQGGNIRRAVMQFDVASAVPPGATINSISLSLRVSKIAFGGPATEMQSFHRLTADWGQGTSNSGDPGGMGAGSTTGDATWIHTFFPASTWTTAGGDFDPMASGTFALNAVTTHSVTSTQMIADVQGWVDNPGTNFGWVLVDTMETPGTAIRWFSSEASSPANRPTLTIDYTPMGGSMTDFCDPANPNSTGLPTVLTGSFGSGVGSDLHLEASSGPPSQFGYFLVGTGVADPGIPVGSGELCLAVAAPNEFGRYNVSGGALNSIGLFDASGVLQNVVGTSTVNSGYDVPSTVPITGSPMISTGQTWYFQLWHREDGGDSNLSNGLSVTF